jgi:hypothetical protein
MDMPADLLSADSAFAAAQIFAGAPGRVQIYLLLSLGYRSLLAASFTSSLRVGWMWIDRCSDLALPPFAEDADPISIKWFRCV